MKRGRRLIAVGPAGPQHSVFCSDSNCPGPANCRSAVLHEVEAADGAIVQVLATRIEGVPVAVVGSLAFPLTAALDVQFALEKAIQSVRLDINATTGEVPPNSWWRG